MPEIRFESAEALAETICLLLEEASEDSPQPLASKLYLLDGSVSCVEWEGLVRKVGEAHEKREGAIRDDAYGDSFSDGHEEGYNEGYDVAEKEGNSRIEELEETNEQLTEKVDKLEDRITDLEEGRGARVESLRACSEQAQPDSHEAQSAQDRVDTGEQEVH